MDDVESEVKSFRIFKEEHMKMIGRIDGLMFALRNIDL